MFAALDSKTSSQQSQQTQAKEDSEEELECAVCLQKCVHPVRLPCTHIFCFLCVKVRWLSCLHVEDVYVIGGYRMDRCGSCHSPEHTKVENFVIASILVVMGMIVLLVCGAWTDGEENDFHNNEVFCYKWNCIRVIHVTVNYNRYSCLHSFIYC